MYSLPLTFICGPLTNEVHIYVRNFKKHSCVVFSVVGFRRIARRKKKQTWLSTLSDTVDAIANCTVNSSSNRAKYIVPPDGWLSRSEIQPVYERSAVDIIQGKMVPIFNADNMSKSDSLLSTLLLINRQIH